MDGKQPFNISSFSEYGFVLGSLWGKQFGGLNKERK
jgi:hypothetical protein